MMNRNAEMRKMVELFNHEKALKLKDELLNKVENFIDINFLAIRIDDYLTTVKDFALRMRAVIENLLLVLGSENDGKQLSQYLYTTILFAPKA